MLQELRSSGPALRRDRGYSSGFLGEARQPRLNRGQLRFVGHAELIALRSEFNEPPDLADWDRNMLPIVCNGVCLACRRKQGSSNS